MSLEMEYKAGFDNVLETKGCGAYHRILSLENLNQLSKLYYDYAKSVVKAKKLLEKGFCVQEVVSGGYLDCNIRGELVEVIKVSLEYIDEYGEFCPIDWANIQNGDYFDSFYC